MIWAVVGLAVLAAGLAVAVAVQAKARSGDKDALIARGVAFSELQVTSAQIQAKLVNERDTALERAGLLAAEVADRDAKIHGLETQLADLSAKVARLTVKLAATLPVSADGAAAVNDLFAEPLPGKEPKKP